MISVGEESGGADEVCVPGPPGIETYNSEDGLTLLLLIKRICVYAGKASIYAYNVYSEPIHLLEDLRGALERNPSLRHHFMVALDELNTIKSVRAGSHG